MKPKAAPHIWPYLDHRSMAQVMEAEEKKRAYDRARYERTRKSWKTAA